MNFKIEIIPPTVTAQEKGVYVQRGKPIFYEKQEVKRAKELFLWYLWQHRPDEPLEGPVFLKTVWIFPAGKRHKKGEYKATKPDTDNQLKLFKDCMTKAGYWKDDSQVCYEVTAKIWGEDPGIEVSVCSLDETMGDG